MKRLFATISLVLLIAAFTAPAQQSATSATQARSDAPPELAEVRDQLRTFESALNQNIAQVFSAPFGYLDQAHGAYLPPYGVVVTFEINLVPNLGLFQPDKLTPAAEKAQREQAKQKRDQARQLAARTLADFGHYFSRLEPQQTVAIVVYGTTPTPRGIDRSTTVVSATKRDIDAFRANSDREAFQRKLTVLDY